MKRLTLFLLCCICGCATAPTIIGVNSVFDPTEANKFLLPGTNKVTGSAVIRQQGGGIVTCAGCKVGLVPVTRYASERMKAYYHSIEKGYSNETNITFIPDPPEYYKARLETVGDAQGMFEFDKVADGDYFVVTTITWTVPTYNPLFGYYQKQQGGNLMQRVRLAGGETKKIVLSP